MYSPISTILLQSYIKKDLRVRRVQSCVTACTANAVLRKACLDSAVLRKACSARAVMRTTSSACFVLHTACSACAVLRTACSKSAVFRGSWQCCYQRQVDSGSRGWTAVEVQRLWLSYSSPPVRRILQRPRTVGRTGFCREEPCTFLAVMYNLTVPRLEFLYCLNARNYFILPLSPIAAVVSQPIILRLTNHVGTHKSPYTT